MDDLLDRLADVRRELERLYEQAMMDGEFMQTAKIAKALKALRGDA